MFILKPQSAVPLYRQLTEQIRRMVASRQLEPGTELPSIRALAVKHAINPMTVSKAYSLLEAEGVLERHRGKPMTVAARRSAAVDSISSRIEQLDGHIENLVLAASQLEICEEDLVRAIRRKWENRDG